MKKLTLSQIEEARVKILENARELIEDAELLLSKGRFARAYTLSHLACEEMVKIPMLVRAAIDTLHGIEFDWINLQRRLHSHQEKIDIISLIDSLFDPDMENNPDIKRLKDSSKRTPSYNKLKNYSLYTSQINNRFKKPSEIIDHEQSDSLLGGAKFLLKMFEAVEIPSQGRLEELSKHPLFKEYYEKFTDAPREMKRREK
ncbi:MAG: AbiV family abortive infection protein [bacterium]|nr:AbiV family abortive infection protein [bacterium]